MHGKSFCSVVMAECYGRPETCMVTYTRCCFALHLVSGAVGPFSLVGVGTEMAIVRSDTVEGGSGVLTPSPPAPL